MLPSPSPPYEETLMSDARNALSSLVKNKFETIRQRQADAKNDSNECLAIASDYGLFFQGAQAAAQAMGLSETDVKPIALALSSLNAEAAAIEQRLQLEAELG